MRELRAIRCPNCGAPLKLLGGGRVLSVTCQYCKSLINLTKEDRVLADFKGVEPPVSYFRVGMEGKINGICWRIIGWIVYRDSDNQKWNEFLLFSPYFGYVWLIDEPNGKLYLSRRVRDLDLRAWGSQNLNPPKNIKYRGRRFFQDDDPYLVVVDYVEGELTWIAKRGDRLYSWDYRSRDGSFINIERSEIEVESYYTSLLDSSKIERAFEIPSSQDNSCKDNIDEILSQDTNQSYSRDDFLDAKASPALATKKEENRDKKSDTTLEADSIDNLSLILISALLTILSLIVIFGISPKKVEDTTVTSSSISRILVPKSNRYTDIFIERVGGGRGFGEVDIELVGGNQTSPILKIKNANIRYIKTLPTGYITSSTKSINARLLLPKGLYYLKTDTKGTKLHITIYTNVVERGYIIFAIVVFILYLLYFIFQEDEYLPKWFIWLFFINAMVIIPSIANTPITIVVEIILIYLLINRLNREEE